MLSLWRDVYATYRGDGESHRLRIIVFGLVALFVAYFGTKLTDAALAMMSVTVSVLTGFTFTSLFAGYGSTTTGLPKPQDESDRHDLKILKTLEQNFRARSKFLILASTLSLIAMVLLSIEVRPERTVRSISKWLLGPDSDKSFLIWYYYGKQGWILSNAVLRGVTVFVFFEALYTFYRLSETVVAALTIRGDYIASHEE